MELKATTTVTKPVDEVYEFWSAFDRFPAFMAHVDDVQVTGPRTSHWKVSAPFDREMEWDAETTEEVPGSRLSWRSKEGRTSRTPARSGSGAHRTGPARNCT
jgi:uncharacterized membrane protein